MYNSCFTPRLKEHPLLLKYISHILMASYANASLPVQRTINKKVNDGTTPDDLAYVASQGSILRAQQQQYIGHYPSYITPISNDNIIMQYRYNANIPCTNPNINPTTQLIPSSSTTDKKPTKIADTFTGPNKNYNPEIDYNQRRGLFNDNFKQRINTTYIDIDSARSRQKTPSIITQNVTILQPDPLSFTTTTDTQTLSNLNLLTISIPNNTTFTAGNTITLENITTNQISVYATYQITGSTNPSTSSPYLGYSIIFVEGSTSMIVKCDYSTSLVWNGSTYTSMQSAQNASMSFNPYFNIGDGISYTDLKAYDTTNMLVTFSGFQGVSIGNIPTNYLNAPLQIYFSNPDLSGDTYINVPNQSSTVTSITGFYIKLPAPFTATTGSLSPLGDTNTSMIINMNFQYVGGIPLNQLSANIPITNSNVYGFFTIYSATSSSISLLINSTTPYYINPTPPTNPQQGQTPISFGGNQVTISLITQINKGDTNPNTYTVYLQNTINNIFNIKLVNTIFPNTAQTFKMNVNDKIYWQNLDDGDNVYSVQIPPGNYDPATLASVLQLKMYAVTRVGVPAVPTTTGGGYTNQVLFVVTIDTDTSITTFTSSKVATLRQPIISIVDSTGAPPPTTITQVGNPPYTLTISHPLHGLSTNDQVLFSGFITTLGVPDTILNTNQTIVNVIDANTYQIRIDNFNLTYDRFDVKGGFAATIYVPNTFRLLLNQPDTIGTELGFRNVGNEIAITKYGTTVSNTDAYLNEIVTVSASDNVPYISNGTGQLIPLTNNSLQFSGNDYIHMAIQEFSACESIGVNNTLPSYFAKINLSGLPGKKLYDTFVQTSATFFDLISISQLTLSFYGSDGALFDFNGIDHSFILEVTSLSSLPYDTSRDSNKIT